MEINVNFKAVELLNNIANSIHDREVKNANPFCFSANEVKITEQWINELIREITREYVNV
jgi:hypothetical protein